MNALLTTTLAITLLSGTALGQTEPTLSLWNGNFRYQINGIIPYDTANRNNTNMGSLTRNYTPEGGQTQTWRTGFGPETDANDRQWSHDTWGANWSCTQHWWWYRATPGDTREYSVSNQTSFVQNSLGQATITYSEPVGAIPNALLFTFVYTLTGEVAGPDTAVVVIDISIQNTSTVTLTPALFSWINLNAGGLQYPVQGGAQAFNDDVWSYQSYADHSEYRVNQSVTLATPYLTFGSIGDTSVQNDRWGGAGSGPQFLRTAFANTTIQDMPRLNSESMPLTTTGIEWSGGVEWLRTLAPGATFTTRAFVGYNTSAPITPPCPADLGQQGGASGQDGSLDNNDFIVFINKFFASDAAADLGRQGGLTGSDGQFDNNDFIAFISLFFAGC
ncbi:MAG: GC-type dockerin domain-anchored protein [Phycisphaerales bacterium]